MSMTKFSEEFSRLIVRYTDTFLSNNDPSNAMLTLTEEEIVHTIHHVLQTLSIKGFEDKKNNLLEISNSTNAGIPKTSDVDIKSKPNDKIKHACRSGQSVFAGDVSTSDILLKINKKIQKNSVNTLKKEKKQSLSQSILSLKEEEKTKMQPIPSELLMENSNIFERRKRTGGIKPNKSVKKFGEFKVGSISNLILAFVLITALSALALSALSIPKM